MRRTTIFRSKRAAWIAFAAVPLIGAPLGAQDTTKAAPPPRDTSLTATASQLPASHTVVKGETLWSIARLYFNDPLLWPEIYRLNTSVIDDPHWIYPGEELAVGGIADTGTVIAQGPATDTTHKIVVTPTDTTVHADTVAKADTAAAPVDTAQIEAPPPPPPPLEPAGGTIFDRPETPGDQVQNSLRAYLNQPYRPLRRDEYYSAGWLTEDEHLPWATVLGTTSVPAIPKLSDRTTASIYEEIALQAPSGASYHIGDSLLLARLDRDVPDWGTIVVPLGIARVTSVQPKQVLADVIAQFGRIRDGNLAVPLEPFHDPGQVRPATVAQGLEGHLIGPRDIHALAGSQAIYFIDRGRTDGVVPGDVFEVYRPATGVPGTASEQVRVQLLIVHTRQNSASGL
ncbi:MAG TPA: LysM peptidoglycan-binding domain-containing protein, partial [Gemmatimonadales bacterium]